MGHDCRSEVSYQVLIIKRFFRGQAWLILIMVGVVLLLAWVTLASQEAKKSETCLLCHRDLPLEPLQASIHRGFSCSTCHKGAKVLPHEEPTDPQACTACHPGSRPYWESIHGRGLLEGVPDVPDCADCHDSHRILPVKDPNSWVFPFNLPQTCGRCHGDEKLAATHQIPVPQAYQQYLESVHGQGLLKSGLLVVATCADCHGTHEIQPKSDPRSRIHPTQIPQTCGRCHVGVLKEHEAGVHGASPQGPVCIDCHRTHATPSPQAPGFRLASVLACANCHPESFETYRESYHGQVTALGYAGVATCSDCHGAHKILPPTEEASTLSTKNIVRTCQACHPAANANFAKFSPHADPRRKAEYPVLYFAWLFMTLLTICVFGVFGLHTMLWAIRGTTERLLVKARSKASDEEGE